MPLIGSLTNADIAHICGQSITSILPHDKMEVFNNKCVVKFDNIVYAKVLDSTNNGNHGIKATIREDESIPVHTMESILNFNGQDDILFSLGDILTEDQNFTIQLWVKPFVSTAFVPTFFSGFVIHPPDTSST